MSGSVTSPIRMPAGITPSRKKRRNRSMANFEGKKAPTFNLEGNDGKKHLLEDYRGKTVVLYFYPKDDTPGCTKEACGFRDLGSSLKKSGAVVLGVSKDSIDSHNKFADKYKLPFTLLSDPKAEIMKKYGAFGKKLMYGKSVEGTIRSTAVIDQGGRSSSTGRRSKKPRTTPRKCSRTSRQRVESRAREVARSFFQPIHRQNLFDL